MLKTAWTKESLELFFENLEGEQNFNMSAPEIKNNEINIASLSKAEAITLMIQNPILIKRPLLEINQTKLCGFDIDAINALLNIAMPKPNDINTCKSSTPCKSV
jgi:nitrogenase-associated protein